MHVNACFQSYKHCPQDQQIYTHMERDPPFHPAALGLEQSRGPSLWSCASQHYTLTLLECLTPPFKVFFFHYMNASVTQP